MSVDFEIVRMHNRFEWMHGAFGNGHLPLKDFLEAIVDHNCDWYTTKLHGTGKSDYSHWAQAFLTKLMKEVERKFLPWKKKPWKEVKEMLDAQCQDQSAVGSFLGAEHYGYYSGQQPGGGKDSATCLHISLRQAIVDLIRKTEDKIGQPKLTSIAKAAYSAMHRLGLTTHHGTTGFVGVVLQDLETDFDHTINLLIQCKIPTPTAMERVRVMRKALIPLLKLRTTTKGVADYEMVFSRATQASHLEEQKEAVAQRSGALMTNPIFNDVYNCQAWSHIAQLVIGVQFILHNRYVHIH
jgi:hypothetical protein